MSEFRANEIQPLVQVSTETLMAQWMTTQTSFFRVFNH